MATIYDLKGKFTYAMHGCGARSGILHSNSSESLDYWRKKGINVFEIDVAKAADGKHVAIAHGLTDDYLRHWEIYDAPQMSERTSEWFTAQKLCRNSSGGLSTMSLGEIIGRLKADEGIIVIFDLYNLWSDAAADFAKEVKKLIAERNELWDRILIECYFQDQVEVVSIVSTKISVIFCVNDMAARRYKVEETSIERLKDLGVGFVSYPWKYSDEGKGIKEYVDAGFTVMSLTHTNLSFRKLRRAGVNIANADILFHGFDVCWLLPAFLIYSLYTSSTPESCIRKS